MLIIRSLLWVLSGILSLFLRPYFYKGHVIYIGNWYTSTILTEFLHDRDTGMCGTVKTNRKGMPKLENKLKRGKVQVAHNNLWILSAAFEFAHFDSLLIF